MQTGLQSRLGFATASSEHESVDYFVNLQNRTEDVVSGLGGGCRPMARLGNSLR